MNRLVRLILIIFSILLALISSLSLLMVINSNILSRIVAFMTNFLEKQSWQIVSIIILVLVLLISLAMLVYALISGRLRKARIRETETGIIEVGVDAIESIALNSARSAQCGIKTAKARVTPYKGNSISVRLSAVLYSDVEVPAMMVKVQERIKKDIERYTGIPVAQVEIKVARVEAIAARIEH